MFFLQEIVLDVLQAVDFFSNNTLDTKTQAFNIVYIHGRTIILGSLFVTSVWYPMGHWVGQYNRDNWRWMSFDQMNPLISFPMTNQDVRDFSDKCKSLFHWYEWTRSIWRWSIISIENLRRIRSMFPLDDISHRWYT